MQKRHRWNNDQVEICEFNTFCLECMQNNIFWLRQSSTFKVAHIFSKVIKGLKAIKHFSVCVNKIGKAPDCPVPVSYINYGPLSDDVGDTWNKCSESVCLFAGSQLLNWIFSLDFYSFSLRFYTAIVTKKRRRNRHWQTFLLYLEERFKIAYKNNLSSSQPRLAHNKSFNYLL